MNTVNHHLKLIFAHFMFKARSSVRHSPVKALLFLVFIFGITAVLPAQSDILDAIEAELRKEQEAKKAAEKAAKNQEKYQLNYRKEIGRAEALHKTRKFDEAIAAYEAAKQWGPTETLPEEQIKIIRVEKEKFNAELKLKAVEDAYNSAKTRADAFMTSKKYDEAIAAYGEALKAKPDESYPKSKISEAQKLKEKADEDQKAVAEIAKLNEAFAKKLADGDAALKIKKWEEAIVHFEEAVKLKPAEPMPKARLEQAKKSKEDEEKFKAQEQLQKEYTAAIIAADGLLKQKKYDEAISAYHAAHKLKPAEAYPKTKIAEAESAKKAEGEAAIRASYNEVVKVADALLKEARYDEAKVKYEEALKIVSTETHPKAMIAEAEKLKAQAEKNAQKTQFDKIIIEGETLLKTQKFNEAIAKFEEAKKVIPGDKKPDELIAEARRLEDQKIKADIEAAYQTKLKEGEVKLAATEFDAAIALFQQAHSMITGETKSRELIAQAEKLKLEKEHAAKDGLFNQKVKASEDLLKNNRFDEAIAGFEAAHQILPSETKTKDLITQAQKLKKEAGDRLLEQEANKLLKEGDDLMALGQYVEAEKKYLTSKTTFAPISATADKKLAALADVKQKFEDEQRNKQQAQAREEQFQSLLNEAESAMTAQDFTKATAALNAALILKPGDKSALAQKAEAEKGLKKHTEDLARQKAAEAESAARAEKEMQVGSLLKEARSLEQSGLLYPTREKVKEALKVIPGHIESADYLNNIEQKITAAEKAKAEELARNEEAGKAEAARQEKIKKLMVEGNASLKADKLEEAEQNFKDVLQTDPNHPEAPSKLNEIKVRREKLAEEVRTKAETEAQAKSEAEKKMRIGSHLAQAQKSIKEKQWDAALNAFEQALILDPQNSTATKGIEDARRLKTEETQSAAAAAEAEKNKAESDERKRLEKEKQEKITTYLADADKMEKKGDVSGAISRIQEAEKLDPQNAVIKATLSRLSNLLEKQVREEEARKTAAEKQMVDAESQKAALAAKTAAEDAIAKANQLISGKSYDEAIRILETAVHQAPGHPALTSLLNTVNELKTKEEIRNQSLAQTQKKEDIKNWLSEATRAFNARELEVAEGYYQRVLQSDPLNTEAKSGLESTRRAMERKNSESLQKEQERAAMTEMQRQIADIISAGDDLFAGGKYEEAMTKYQEGLKLAPLHVEIKESIRQTKESLTMRERILMAKKSGQPRPRPIFKTENASGQTGERKDIIKFHNELGKRYPPGVTEEVSELPRKSITRRVVVKNEIGREFLRVRHDWGGTYYFKDGVSTSPFIWQLETRSADSAN